MSGRRLILRSLVLLCLVAITSGCATSGKTFTEAQGGLPPIATGQGRIFLYRTSVLGAAVQPSVKVNDAVVGSAVPRGFFFVDRPAGDYKISTSTEVERTLSLTLVPGQVRYVRLNIGMGFFVGHVWPELVEDTEGLSEIGSCRLVTS